MRKFALKNNILCFDHDPNIGGRFSIFSITSLLPLLSIGHSLPSIIKSFNKAKKYLKKIIVNYQSILTTLLLMKKNLT